MRNVATPAPLYLWSSWRSTSRIIIHYYYCVKIIILAYWLVIDRWSSISVMPIYIKIGFWSSSCNKALMTVRLFSYYTIYFCRFWLLMLLLSII